MSDVQQQINEINRKLDVLLDHVNQQRLRSEAADDLISDLSIIGKDVYNTAVNELENHTVEIDIEEVKLLFLRFVKNIGNFARMLEFFESMNDLLKDAKPIANEIIIDFTKKMNEFDQKGYFDFLREMGKMADNIITHFSKEDIQALSENMVNILETVKSITQPDMLKSINNGLTVFKNMDVEDIPEYSIWKLMREMKSPEMKKGMGFIVTFLKNMAGNENSNQTINN